MPAVQTSYSESIPDLVVGQIADSSPCVVDSYEVASSQAQLAFGVAVQRSADTDTIIDGAAPVTGGTAPFTPTEFLGITVKDPARPANRYPRTDTNSANQYVAGDIAAVITQGDVAVLASGTGAVDRGDGVTIDPASGALGNAGTDGAGDATHPRIPGALWRTSVAASATGNDRLAVVRLSGFVAG